MSSNLVEEARTGSKPALNVLFEQYRNYLLMLAASEISPQLRAKVAPSDVVQDTLLEAQRDFPGFAGSSEEQFRVWIRQILLNNLANLRNHYEHSQRRQVARELPIHGPTSSAILPLRDPAPTPSQQAIRREEDAALDEAIAQLPADYQEVMRLRHGEGLGFEEVGRRLGRSAEAARKLWTRALERLQQTLKEPDP